MKVLIPVILSIISFVGGHFYNKRIDRAIFFLSLLIFWCLILFIISPFAMFNSNHSITHISLLKLLRIGIIFLWICSFIVTLFDSKKTKVDTLSWSICGTIGAYLLSIFMCLSFFIIVKSFFMSNIYKKFQGKSIHEPVANNFLHSVSIGGLKYPYSNLPLPPEGKGQIKGKFVIEGKPVEGIKLIVYLNGKFKTKEVTTNNEGIFKIDVPYGIWYINRIETTSWVDKPAGFDFEILHCQEGTIEDYKKTPYYWPETNGIQFDISKESSMEPVIFKIKRTIKLLWPGGIGKQTVSDISKSIIHWESYPEATDYIIWISEVERNNLGTSLGYAPIFSTVIHNDTKIPVSKLPLIQNKTKTEYEVQLFAFSSDGSLLSVSGIHYRHPTFFLRNFKIIKKIQ